MKKALSYALVLLAVFSAFGTNGYATEEFGISNSLNDTIIIEADTNSPDIMSRVYKIFEDDNINEVIVIDPNLNRRINFK